VCVCVRACLGLILVSKALSLAKTLTLAVRISTFFVTGAACFLIGYASERNEFFVHVALLILTGMFTNFPFIFYKQLPGLLGMSASMKMFALSRFTLIYSLFGDIAGWQVMGIMIDEFGVTDSLWVLVAVGFVASVCWLIATAWSFIPRGHIDKLSLEQAAKQKALTNWKLLGSVGLKKVKYKNAFADTMFRGPGAVLAWMMFHSSEEEKDQVLLQNVEIND